MKAIIQCHDAFNDYIMDKEECCGLFGEDYWEDYSKDIPDELAIEFFKVQKQWKELQEKVSEYKRKNDL